MDTVRRETIFLLYLAFSGAGPGEAERGPAVRGAGGRTRTHTFKDSRTKRTMNAQKWSTSPSLVNNEQAPPVGRHQPIYSTRSCVAQTHDRPEAELYELPTQHVRQEGGGFPPRGLRRHAIVPEGRVGVEPLRRVGPRVRRAWLGLGLGVRVKVRVRVRVRVRVLVLLSHHHY